MTKKYFLGMFAVFVLGFSLLGISAAPVEKTDGFVCPVFHENSAVGDHNPNAVPIANGDYTIVGPEVSVPYGATNDDGAGSPGGDHLGPTQPGYTAVWAGQ